MKTLIGILVLFGVCGIQAQHNLVSENEAIARAFVESWTIDTYMNLASLFAESGMYNEMPSGRVFNGRLDIENYASATLYGIPDTETEVISVVANEKMAAVEWTMSGTNTVGWPNIPASGNSFSLPIVSVMKIQDGLIVENRDYWDWETFHGAVSE